MRPPLNAKSQHRVVEFAWGRATFGVVDADQCRATVPKLSLVAAKSYPAGGADPAVAAEWSIRQPGWPSRTAGTGEQSTAHRHAHGAGTVLSLRRGQSIGRRGRRAVLNLNESVGSAASSCSNAIHCKQIAFRILRLACDERRRTTTTAPCTKLIYIARCDALRRQHAAEHRTARDASPSVAHSARETSRWSGTMLPSLSLIDQPFI